MPLLYGEGAIWAQTADHTIFAWTLGGYPIWGEYANLKPRSESVRYAWTRRTIEGRRNRPCHSFLSEVSSHFAIQPAAFAKGGGTVSIPRSEYIRRLGRLPFSHRIQTTPSYPGGPIYLPLIPFVAWLPSRVVDTVRSSLSKLYLVPLACAWRDDRLDDSDNLVAIICTTEEEVPDRTDSEPSPTSVVAPKGTFVFEQFEDGRLFLHRTVVLTRSDLDRCRDSIQSLGVLPNSSVGTDLPAITLVTGQSEDSVDTSATAHLAQWSRSSLAAQGYEATVLSPIESTGVNGMQAWGPIHSVRFTRAGASTDVLLQYFDPATVTRSNLLMTTVARLGLVRQGLQLNCPGDFLGVSGWVYVYEGQAISGTVLNDLAHGPGYHFTATLRRVSGNTFELGFDMVESRASNNTTPPPIEASDPESPGGDHGTGDCENNTSGGGENMVDGGGDTTAPRAAETTAPVVETVTTADSEETVN